MQEGKQRGRKDKLYAQMSAQRSEIWGGLVGAVVFVKINSSNRISAWSLKKKRLAQNRDILEPSTLRWRAEPRERRRRPGGFIKFEKKCHLCVPVSRLLTKLNTVWWRYSFFFLQEIETVPSTFKLSSWCSGNSPPANAGDTGSIPGPGRCPGEGNGNSPRGRRTRTCVSTRAGIYIQSPHIPWKMTTAAKAQATSPNRSSATRESLWNNLENC